MSGDDDDDLQLKSLRAVWLDMPDEEPPERGLADLLAAARTKAVEMAEPTPSTWQRFLALLRRPPVLALATVLVIVGGIALVGGRTEKSSAPAISPASNGEPTTTKVEMAAPQTAPPAAGAGDDRAPEHRNYRAPEQRLDLDFGGRARLDEAKVSGESKEEDQLAHTAVMIDAGVESTAVQTGATTAQKAGLAAPARAKNDRATTIDSTAAEPAE